MLRLSPDLAAGDLHRRLSNYLNPLDKMLEFESSPGHQTTFVHYFFNYLRQ